MKSDYAEDPKHMADNPPIIRQPSVTTKVTDNGNRTAVEQWLLLTILPALVLSALYLAIRSQMTAAGWYDLFTLIGVAASAYALLRYSRWQRVDLDPAKTRRPDAARFGLNLIINSWPVVLAVLWQVLVVENIAYLLDERWPIVVVFITLACAIFATVFIVFRLVRELRDPLAGNSIEIGVRERELKHELKIAKLEADKNRGRAEYAQQLEEELARTKDELARAQRSSRVIYSNHGSARGNSQHVIDDNELLNVFVYRAFSGEQHKRDEWCRILDPGAKTLTVGRQRYDSFRAILANAGLWDMKTGPTKPIDIACEALSIPLPKPGQPWAGGRAGETPTNLATQPDFDESEE